ncbi:MAG TPA: ChbG/HpnK family deacetylase, partial [Phototrophicaceae bacterium]|nr:ChbG/HpnK family deacetylase [Phototrophicaceae bacterium]
MTVQPNPVLRKLGLADTDRAVIIHVDDLGAYQSALPAYAELLDFGLISSGAVMTPCPWFPAVAAFCREQPQADVGLHATLNSEWTVCRWGPVSTRDAATGLLDDEGYFHQWPPATYACADPAAVGVELEAQVQMARKAGINLTHVDTHMGTSTHAKFRSYHIQTALKYGLPPMIVLRGDEAIYRR